MPILPPILPVITQQAEKKKLPVELTPEERAKFVRKKAGLQKEESEASRKELQDLSDRYRMLLAIRKSFSDEFAGNRIRALGELENKLERRYGDLPLVKDVVSEGQGDWWSKYQEAKNIVRHDLFGGNLTEGEAEEFAKQDIGPEIKPTSVKATMDWQLGLLADKLNRRVNYWNQKGAENIESIMGEDVFDDVRSRSVIPDLIKKGISPSGKIKEPKSFKHLWQDE